MNYSNDIAGKFKNINNIVTFQYKNVVNFNVFYAHFILSNFCAMNLRLNKK